MLMTSIRKIKNGEDLSENEMKKCMEIIMTGEASDIIISSFLTALATKGESIEEITGGAKVLRKKATNIDLGNLYTVDTCGTGGDESNTFNISTAVSIVVAAAGIKVVKHGNRAVSSLCGSADVLEALGVNINLKPCESKQCIEKIGISFLYAPLYHNAMKHVAIVRKTLGFRTIFNILGPLVNPAIASAQVLGVYHEKLTEPMARVLQKLGVNRAMTVHGLDGLDEITITRETKITELNQDKMKTYYIVPEQFNLGSGNIEDLRGGNKEENAKIIRELFQGMQGPKRDIVLLNAGAAIYIGNIAKSLNEGVEIAKNVIDSKKAYEKLKAFIEITNSYLGAK